LAGGRCFGFANLNSCFSNNAFTSEFYNPFLGASEASMGIGHL